MLMLPASDADMPSNPTIGGTGASIGVCAMRAAAAATAATAEHD
jgi:hypothetical protein